MNIFKSAIEKNPGFIVLCENVFTNKEIIEFLPTIPEDLNVLFYENGAASIVGSPDKNEKGIFIPMN